MHFFTGIFKGILNGLSVKHIHVQTTAHESRHFCSNIASKGNGIRRKCSYIVLVLPLSHRARLTV